MFTLSSLCLPSTSTSTSTSLFLPIAAGRNRHDAKPPRPTRKSPPRRRRGPLPSSSSSYGSQATTFTRLPRKDDDPSLHTEIPLSHFSLPRFSHLDPPSPSQPEVHIDHDNDDQEEEEIWAFEYEDLAEDEEGKAPDEHGEEEEEANGVKRKEKGLPAVMRCFDRTKIYVKAGGGGNGVVAFRREKYVPHGGPSGGDGGRGGHVYFEVDPSMNSLLPFRKCVHFRAGRGGHGQGSKQRGAAGEGVVVKVPPGTDVRLAAVPRGSGEVLLEMMKPGQRAMLLPGGRGGRGNASFKSALNRVPKIAEYGEEGLDMWLELELKLVADVGIVGAPNAGKSTLLSAISAAQPEIANYPFTTLLPNLGVVSLDFDATMVVADLPGLLEGAHLGYGVGHEFLRHTERCLVLVHVVDGSGEQPEYEFDAVRLELELFNPDLAEKPFIVAYNKMDLPDACARWASFQKHLQDHGIEPFCISAATRMGTQDLVCTTYKLLRKGLDAKKQTEDWAIPMNLNHVAEAVERQRSTPMSDFDIFRDGNTLHVTGAGIQRFIQMTNWEYKQSIRRFLHALEACGVNKALIEAGVKEGDTVIVGEMEMVWHDSSGQLGGNSGMRKQTGSIRWPCL